MPAVLERALARYRRAVIATERAKQQPTPADVLNRIRSAEQAAHDEVLAAARPPATTTQK